MEIRQSLESNFLTCRICSQHYQQPKVLECLHTFCCACLEELFRKEKESSAMSNTTTHSSSSSYYSRKYSYGSGSTREYRINCPVCDKRTAIPRVGPSALPDDLLAEKLASMVGKMPNYPVCDVCTPDFLPLPHPAMAGRASSRNNVVEGASDSDNESSETRSYSSRRRNRKQHKSLVLAVKASTDRDTVSLNNNNNGHSESPKCAISACLDCAKRLCEYCQVTHSNMAVTEDHILIRVEQMDEMRCLRHPREMRRFYCRTCECCICLVCTFDQADPGSDHTEHNVMTMRQAVDHYQLQIDHETAEVQIHVEQLERLLDGMRICQSHVTSVSKSIDAAADKLVNSIRDSQQRLKMELESRAGIEIDDLEPKCNSVGLTIDAWYTLTKDETFSQRLDLMNPIEALDSAIPLLEQIKDVLHDAEKQCEPSPRWQQLYSRLRCLPKGSCSPVGSDTESVASSVTTNSTPGGGSRRSMMRNKKRVAFKLDFEEPPSIDFWYSVIGRFHPGKGLNLGRLLTPQEERDAGELWKDRAVQADPVDRRNASLQTNMYELNKEDKLMQTDQVPLVLKCDNGSQYLSSDINAPIILFRGGKQISVQK